MTNLALEEIRDYLLDSYVRRIWWEARVYALQYARVQNEMFAKGKKRGNQQGDAPLPKGGVVSAEAFLASLG